MADNAADAKTAYARQPWRQAYASDISPDFEPLADTNLGALIRRSSERFADRTAFTTCLDNGLNGSLRFAEVERLSDQFARFLLGELGLSPGDRVAIQMPNCLAYPVTAFGVFKAGLVLVNVNPLYTAPEMQQQLKDSGARALVLIDLFADKLETGLQDTDVEQVILAGVADFFPLLSRALIRAVLTLKRELPRPARPVTRFTRALELGRTHAGQQLPEPNQKDLAALQYTGGTTGVPKGAMLSQANLLANLAQIQAIARPALREEGETVLTALPLYHIFAFSFNLMTFYMNGAHNILCPSPRPPSKLRKAFEKYPVTKFSGVNLLFRGLLKEDWFRSNPPAIDMSIAGGTALHEAVAEEWQELVGSPICEGYGLSESSPVVSVNQPSGEIRLGTIGLPVPGTEVLILGDDGSPVPLGEEGELAVRGPQLFSGYWQQEEETRNAIRDGWFLTGDMACMGEDGFLRIVDRKKDMIDVGGFNVYPNEVEQALERHPGIDEAAVIGHRDEEGNESVLAFVVRNDATLDEDAVNRHAKDNLTGYKRPRHVVFRDELPKTSVGKVLRKTLRDEVSAD
ncbi:AMP-binding protein [Methylonatrum kenyense]|uniref:AMP-binding protein n=1 Tax=Methylonatrum kenyense TaxID=455253 RepID=UPI0020C13A1E|nr:AMP-binding protein [Methylonatrum kenyense]MCK8516186.1 AMP-binding protein [Methylonatrum kenyense]